MWQPHKTPLSHTPLPRLHSLGCRKESAKGAAGRSNGSADLIASKVATAFEDIDSSPWGREVKLKEGLGGVNAEWALNIRYVGIDEGGVSS